MAVTTREKLLPMAERQARINQANEFIKVIASCGRQFFRYENRVAYFFMNNDGRLWFRDAYSYKCIYVMYRYEWHGFSNGGTLRSLVKNLADWIRVGKPVWSGFFDGQGLWAYDDVAMAKVREAAKTFTE